jgi:hypothetical protein
MKHTRPTRKTNVSATMLLLLVLTAALSLSLLGFDRTPVQAQSAACSPVTGTIRAPFSYDGAGTFCWQASDLGAYINSWNLTSLTVNGVSFTNTYAASSSLPPKIDGSWYVSYSGAYAWSHFEAAGASGPTATSLPGPTSTPTATAAPTTPAATPTTSAPTPTSPAATPTSPAATPTPTASVGDGTPYGGTAVNLPGTVQAENYNVGGEGVAYHDTDAANNSGQYRTGEGVDVETTTDTGGGYNISWTAAGEWTTYTVNAAAAGIYTADFRVAAPNTGATFHLEVDGVNVTGAVAVPSTGGWQSWQTLSKTGVSLSAGQHVLRLVTDSGGANYNWIALSRPASTTTAWQDGQFNVDVANVVRQSNIVLASANTGVLDMMPLGNGRLGAAVWAANGFTAQLNRAADTFPARKSQGWLTISGLTGLGGGALDLYDAMFTRSGGGMTATSYVLQNKDELVVDVTGANVSTTYTAQIQLWSGRSPAASASGAFATLSETWTDGGSAGSGQTFGTLAGLTASGRNVAARVVNTTTIEVSFNPNTDGTFRVIVASPAWAGGNAMTTTISLIGSDATASTGSLRQTHLGWWHSFWANTGLIKISGQNGPYVQNIRDIELYSMALSNSSAYPGNHAGVLDIVSPNKDGVTWPAPDYWWWNLRMHVGTLLGAGHPELTTPFFNLYKNNLANIQRWSRDYIGGDGASICVPETMRYNGNGYYGSDIGNASCKSPGPSWNALTQSTGAEISLWIWQRYLQTRDQSFLSAHYPILANSARYYLAKAPVGGDGRRHIYPSNAHENQWNVHDPTTDIAAMKALFPVVVQAAQVLNTDSALVSQLQSAVPQIPDYPRTDWQTKQQVLNASNDASGNTMIAMSMDPTAQNHNSENTGLELLYPYNLIGLNSSANLLALANRTYDHRTFVNANTWTFDPLQAARLGRASNFQSNVLAMLQKYQTFTAGYSQQSSTDYTPYVETAGVVAAAVQDALVQDFDDVLRIAPAWPMSSWDVDGTVFIHDNSKVHVQVKGGQLTTVVLVSGKTGSKAVVNPWGGQSVNVVNAASGAVVVNATTAAQLTIPVTAGQAYIIQLVAQPLSAQTFAQVTASPASSKKTLGAVKLGN